MTIFTLKKIAIILGGVIMLGASCGKAQQDGGVFRSTDAGGTWEQIVAAGRDSRNRAVTIADLSVLTLTSFPWNSNWLYLGSQGQGIYVSADGGEQWQQLDLKTGNIRSIAIDRHNPTTIFAAKDSTVVRSLDGGSTWELVYTDANGSLVNVVLVDTYDNSRVYIATNRGQIFKSIDGGANWDIIFDTNAGITKLVMASYDTRIIYALTSKQGVFVTKTGGAFDDNLKDSADYINSGWTELFTEDFKDQFGKTASGVFSLTLDPQDNSTIYISTKRGLMKGVNTGEQWSDVINLFGVNDPNNEKITNLTVAPDNNHTLYYTLNTFIYKSSDQGRTWQVFDRFPSQRILSTLFINPTTPTTLYLGTQAPPDDGNFLKVSKKK